MAGETANVITSFELFIHLHETVTQLFIHSEYRELYGRDVFFAVKKICIIIGIFCKLAGC